MSSKLNWERSNKETLIRKRGSASGYDELPKTGSKADKERKGVKPSSKKRKNKGEAVKIDKGFIQKCQKQELTPKAFGRLVRISKITEKINKSNRPTVKQINELRLLVNRVAFILGKSGNEKEKQILQEGYSVLKKWKLFYTR